MKNYVKPKIRVSLFETTDILLDSVSVPLKGSDLFEPDWTT